jgi:hypothetical protein
MSLGQRKSGGGSILPLLKFDARHGSLHLEHSVKGFNGWQREQTDVGSRFRAVFDLANVQVGWVKFPRGAAPLTVLVPVGQDPGEPPDDDYKDGFRLLALMDESLGGGVHEFMSTSVSAWNGVSALHDTYLAERDRHPGQLPLVGVKEIVERAYANGNSFEPVFTILKWVPRPEEFGAAIETLKQTRRPAPPKPTTTDMDDAIPF